MTEQTLQRARALHQAGRLPEALAGYAAVLAAEPKRADVWHLKGVAEHQAGQHAAAVESVGQAIATGGEQPPYVLLRGLALHDAGDLPGAEAQFVRAAELKPGWFAPWVELGTLRFDQGRAEAALEAYRQATAADANNARAWNGLALTMMALDRLDEAVRALNHLLTFNPRYALAHFNLARIANVRLDDARALAHAQSAVQLDPNLSEAHLLIGDIQRRKRDPVAAQAAYATAVRAAPGNVKARAALAELLGEIGRHEEARAEYRRLSTANPRSLKAAFGANLLLPQVYLGADHVADARREYADGLGQLERMAGNFRYATPEAALADARWTNFYLAYQGGDDRALQRRYGEFLKGVLQANVPELYAPRPRHAGRAKVRVGFLSHFFFNCTAGRYFASWVKRLDKSRFEVFVYYTNEWMSDDSKAIAAAADTFRHLPGRPLLTTARTVAADDLDILVYPELGMHPDTFALASLRLAPVQCSGWGHPDSPGHPELDWFISCEAMEPALAQDHYSERLALLPGLGTHYVKPSTDVVATREEFGLPGGKTLYLVPQSLFKIHPDNDDLLARVMERDPDGILVMFASQHDAIMNAFAQRLALAFARRGMELADRSRFVMPMLPHGAYLALNKLCDVMLDTLHWSGGNTSLDALAMGLPVVTLPGAYMRGRQSRAMLETLGAPELIVGDAEAYVETAVRLGRDAAERRALSERLLANGEALFGRDEPVRALEDFLEKAVREA